ncbi:MAG: DoxX family protein [Bacteriovorax sp.]|nr:DoxX family protein [Bacteriovorax sp.]
MLCLLTSSMKNEFKRFGLTDQLRKLTGFLELLGGFGLLVGLRFPLILLFSSIGLSALMFLGFLVRLKIKDGLILSSPAFILMLLNICITYNVIKFSNCLSWSCNI